jgi:hypothetical protein
MDPSRSSGRRRAARRHPWDALWGVPLACTEQGVGSIPTVSTSCLRSVNGSTRPLYGRGAGSTPAGGSSIHTRTPVAQRSERCRAKAEGRWFESSRAYARGCSSSGRAPERHFGEARSSRVVRSHSPPSKAPGVTESTASSNLAGPGSTPGGPARSTVAGRSGSVISGERRKPAVRIRIRPHPTTATTPTLRAGRSRLSTTNRQVAGSSPARSSRAPVAQLVEQFRASHTTAA